MRKLPFLCLMVLFSCDRSRLANVESEFSTAPTQIDFSPAFVGYEKTRELTFKNDSKGRLEISIECPASLRCEALSVVLESGEHKPFKLVWAPKETGSLSETITLSDRHVEQTVTVSGTAKNAPPCEAPELCQQLSFNAETGTCVASNLPNGTNCGAQEACVVEGQCLDGACMGTTPKCDDGNSCTQDACSLGVGCTSVASNTCQKPSNPCLASVCDPVTGCGTVFVPDGTACGAVSCDLANVCMSGACKTLVPPEGFACTPSTPCQDEGRCQNKVCVPGAAKALQSAWQLTSGPEIVRRDFQGVVDIDENIYWVDVKNDAKKPQAFAVSYTKDGMKRFETPIATKRNDGFLQMVTMGDFVVTEGNSVAFIDRASGSLRWEWNVPRPQCSGDVSEFAAATSNSIFVIAENCSNHNGSQLFVLDSQQGVFQSQSISLPFQHRYLSGLVVDAFSRVYVGSTGTSKTAPHAMAAPVYDLFQLDARGKVIAFDERGPNPASPLLTYGGSLGMSDGTEHRLGSKIDGWWLGHQLFELAQDFPLLESPKLRVAFVDNQLEVLNAGLYLATKREHEALEQVALRIQSPAAAINSFAPKVTEPFLDDDEGTMMSIFLPHGVCAPCARTNPVCACTSNEIRRYKNGGLDYSCGLPLPTVVSVWRSAGHQAVLSGRIVYSYDIDAEAPMHTIQAIDTPTVKLEKQGWGISGGSPARTRQARP